MSSAAKATAATARKMLDDIAHGIKVDISVYWNGADEPSGPTLVALRLKVAEQIIALEKYSAVNDQRSSEGVTR